MKLRPLVWASGIVLGALLVCALWVLDTAYSTKLSTLVECADDPSRPVSQWLCKHNIYLLRLMPDEVKDLNAMAGASLAVQLNDKEEAERMLKFFLSRGVDINSKDTRTDEAGLTALHKAVIANQPAKIALLLAHGAVADVRNSEYQTPIELARELQQQRPQEDRGAAIKLLVEAGRPKYSGFVRQGG